MAPGFSLLNNRERTYFATIPLSFSIYMFAASYKRRPEYPAVSLHRLPGILVGRAAPFFTCVVHTGGSVAQCIPAADKHEHT